MCAQQVYRGYNQYLLQRSCRWPKGFELHLRDFSSQSSQGGRVEGVSRLGEWMGLKSVLTFEGAHLPYGQAMRSWLPQDTHKLSACGGCSCQGRPPRPRVTIHLRDRKTMAEPAGASAETIFWVPYELCARERSARRLPGKSRRSPGGVLGGICVPLERAKETHQCATEKLYRVF